MKNSSKKIALRFETLRQLSTADLAGAIGGAGVIGTVADPPATGKCPLPTPTAGCTTHN